MKKILLSIFSLTILCSLGYSQKTMRDYPQVIQSIQTELESQIKGEKLRISIPNFNTSQKKFQTKTEIGEYFSDKLAVTLIKSKKIKMYERSKLNNILKEHEMLMSGVIDEDDVVKLGELAPIDAILFGSYLKMKTSVEITLRLVSVTSGEIEWSFSEKISLNEELDSLFSGETEVKKMTDEERIGLIANKLKNITSQDDIDQITHLLKQIPLFSQAGDVHQQVIQEYHQMKLYDAAYAEFLSSELSSIDKILNENTFIKCNYVLHYIKEVDGLSDDEFNMALDVLKKWNKYYEHRTFIYLFFDIPQDQMTFEQRKQKIDEFLQMEKEGTLKPLRYDDIYLSLSYLYHSRNVNSQIHDNRLVVYVLDKMFKDLTIKGSASLMAKLAFQYIYTPEEDIKDKIFSYYCEVVNHQKINKSLGHNLFSMARNLEKAGSGLDKKNEYNGKHLKVFLKRCGPTIIKTMTEIKPSDNATWNTWKKLYESNGLKIPGDYK